MLEGSRSAWMTLRARSFESLVIRCTVSVAIEAVFPLRRLKESRHALHRIGRRVRVIDVVEEGEKRLRGPLVGEPQQVEQIPDFDGVHLHRRRRQEHQPVLCALSAPA